MATKKTPKNPSKQDLDTYYRVLAGLKKKGSSIEEWSRNNNHLRGNVDKALKGLRRGKKAKALRSQIIQDSKAKPAKNTQQATQ